MSALENNLQASSSGPSSIQISPVPTDRKRVCQQSSFPDSFTSKAESLTHDLNNAKSVLSLSDRGVMPDTSEAKRGKTSAIQALEPSTQSTFGGINANSIPLDKNDAGKGFDWKDIANDMLTDIPVGGERMDLIYFWYWQLVWCLQQLRYQAQDQKIPDILTLQERNERLFHRAQDFGRFIRQCQDFPGRNALYELVMSSIFMILISKGVPEEWLYSKKMNPDHAAAQVTTSLAGARWANKLVQRIFNWGWGSKGTALLLMWGRHMRTYRTFDAIEESGAYFLQNLVAHKHTFNSTQGGRWCSIPMMVFLVLNPNRGTGLCSFEDIFQALGYSKPFCMAAKATEINPLGFGSSLRPAWEILNVLQSGTAATRLHGAGGGSQSPELFRHVIPSGSSSNSATSGTTNVRTGVMEGPTNVAKQPAPNVSPYAIAPPVTHSQAVHCHHPVPQASGVEVAAHREKDDGTQVQMQPNVPFTNLQDPKLPASNAGLHRAPGFMSSARTNAAVDASRPLYGVCGFDYDCYPCCRHSGKESF